MHIAICGRILFTISEDKSPSHIQSKYRLGSISSGIIYLTAYEALLLTLRGKISPENPALREVGNLIQAFNEQDGFIDRFFLYDLMKSKGLYVKSETGDMFFRKTPREDYKGPVRIVREERIVSFADLMSSQRCIYAAIDDDHDITMFTAEAVEPHGTVNTSIPGETAISNLSGSLTASTGDIPEWMGNRLGDVRLLNIYEATTLSGKELNVENIVQSVYADLIGRGFIVRTGFKYGCNFRIYGQDLAHHAEYLVHVIDGTEEWYKISRAVRVAQGVRKEMIFAGYHEGKIRYIKIKRVRDPFLEPDQIWDSKSSIEYAKSE